ncbi:MAG: DUF4164 domain-containing protein [Hyphomicrobiales bacterium]
MELDHILKQSLRGLESSFDALDNALMKQANGAQTNDGLTDELNMLIEDRSRMAAQLDEAQAKIETLESVNQEIEHRVDVAMQQLALLLSEEDGL